MQKELANKMQFYYVLLQRKYLLFRIDSINGDYKSAMNRHIQYKLYSDSLLNIEQRKKVDELMIKYGAEKKDRDIKSLQKEQVAQQTKEEQGIFIRNMMIAAIALLVLSVGLLFNQFKLKQRTNKKISSTNTALQQLVEEKQWLLKEVHHRVKNNLQVMVSLLSTQSNYLENDAAIKAIRESQQRMHAISLIHHKLYQSEETAFINLREYIQELVAQIKNGVGQQVPVVFELDVVNIQLDVAQAVPLGLILNEAITNAIKYAFQRRLRGKVVISVTPSTTESFYLLTISDDGVGFPPGYDHFRMTTFGMRLMHGLSRQLGGTFRTGSNNGALVEVAFKISRVIDLFYGATGAVK
jgi:two-component sensor histidine kinase